MQPEPGTPAPPPLSRVDVLPAIALAIVASTLFLPIVRLWWTYDDAFLLHYVLRHRPVQYLVSPAIWQELPQQLFTPVLMLSYGADVVLGGMATRWYYGHHLLEIVVFIVLVYATARLWNDRSASLLCAWLILFSAPFNAWATQLMLRHYLESSIAALGATLLFAAASRRGRRRDSLVSGGLYFVAICAKEIAVPLPLILFLIHHGSLRDRARAIAPHAAALLLYSVWRRSMLGTFFGGYGWAVTADDVPRLLVHLLPTMVRLWSSPLAWAGLTLTLLCAIVIALGLRGRPAVTLAITGLLCAVLPIAPVSKDEQLRFAMVPWVAVAFCVAAAMTAVRRSHSPTRVRALAASLVLLAIVVHFAQWRRTFGEALRMSAEGRAFLDLEAGAMLRNPIVPPAAMGELQWLKAAVYHRTPAATWSFDDIHYCLQPMPARVVDFERYRVRDVTAAMPAFVQRYCGARAPLPLTARFTFRKRSLFWELGPYRQGQYRFILGDGVQAFDVPARDGFQMGTMPGITLRIRYRAPEGTVAYSPPIALDFATMTETRWEGSGEVR